MSEADAPKGAGEQAEANQPRLSILTQYVKDLSFENPRAPMGLAPGQPRPEIQISVETNARQIGEQHFEVTLQINIDAKSGRTPSFSSSSPMEGCSRSPTSRRMHYNLCS